MNETRHGNEATTTSNTPGDLTQPTTSTHNNNANVNIENVITGNDNDNDSNTNYISKQTASMQRIINNTNNNGSNVISTSNANDHHDNKASEGNTNEKNDNEDILSHNNTNHNDYKGHGINAPISNDASAQITVTTTTATTPESDPVQGPITKHPRTSICTQGTSPRVVKISTFRYCYANLECLVPM